MSAHLRPAEENLGRREISAAPLPADPLILQPCTSPGCGALSLTRHCESHANPEERACLSELHDASVEMVQREEQWRAARAHVAELEAALGILRRSPTPS